MAEKKTLDVRNLHFSTRYLEAMKMIEKMQKGDELELVSATDPKALIYRTQWDFPEVFDFTLLKDETLGYKLIIKRR